MARCIVMDASGDSRHEFDTSDVSARTLAQQQFKHLTGSGFRAVALDGRGGTGRLQKQFDPQVEQSVFIPQLQGG
jgi:hypothetical protein